MNFEMVNEAYPLVNKPIAIENGQFIFDLPIKHGNFQWFFVCLPEGNDGFHNAFSHDELSTSKDLSAAISLIPSNQKCKYIDKGLQQCKYIATFDNTGWYITNDNNQSRETVLNSSIQCGAP
jgi:hypothetical protein